MGVPRGYKQAGKHCPYCGATKSAWTHDPKKAVVDISTMTYVGKCHFEPEEIFEYSDRKGVAYERPDLRSLGWECSHCGRSMMGGDGGWFDVETGDPLFSFCPHCGWRVDARKTRRSATRSWRAD